MSDDKQERRSQAFIALTEQLRSMFASQINRPSYARDGSIAQEIDSLHVQTGKGESWDGGGQTKQGR